MLEQGRRPRRGKRVPLVGDRVQLLHRTQDLDDRQARRHYWTGPLDKPSTLSIAVDADATLDCALATTVARRLTAQAGQVFQWAMRTARTSPAAHMYL